MSGPELPLPRAESDLLGLARLGQGREAEIFALTEDRVLKVMRPGGSDRLDREAAAMRAAHTAGLPVPNAYELFEVGGRRSLVMDRVRGVDLLSLVGRQPWRLSAAGTLLGRVHARIHQATAPSGLPSLKELAGDRLRRSDLLTAAVRDRALSLLDRLPDGDRLCHLDFHPANVMVAGWEPAVIDWPNAARGDPLADAAMTLVTLEGGTVPPGTPLLTRLLTPLGRGLIRRGYWNAYRRSRPVNSQHLSWWRAIAAAQRLTYGLQGEEAWLARIVLD